MHNRTKALLDAGKVAFGVQLRFGTPAIAELFAHAGFDFVMTDGEHAPQTPVGVQAQFQAMGCTDTTPIARLTSNDPDLIRVYLDMGALGVFVPFITSAEQARIGAQALRYPPQGTRGYGPARASNYGLDEAYFKTANENMLYLPNIEDKEAIRNIDEILAVEGVDSFIIGPVDLSISLGNPMEFHHPKFRDAVNTVLKAAEARNTPAGAGIYGADANDPDVLKRFVDQGFRLLLVGGDEWMLTSGCKTLMDSCSKIKD